MGTAAIWNAKCRTRTCHRNTPYDHRPRVVRTVEPRTAKRSPPPSAVPGPAGAVDGAPAGASAAGARRQNATTAPSAVRIANSGPDGCTNPSVNHCGTVLTRNAAAATAHHPHRAWRWRASAAARPGGAQASSARIIPAANHDANAGGRIWSLSRSCRPSSYHGRSAHPRLATPTTAIAGMRHRAARPRRPASAHHSNGSTR
ncbi:hypothetical protein GCM10009832_29550 [Dietzia kunjamensis subsp. schimae]